MPVLLTRERKLERASTMAELPLMKNCVLLASEGISAGSVSDTIPWLISNPPENAASAQSVNNCKITKP